MWRSLLAAILIVLICATSHRKNWALHKSEEELDNRVRQRTAETQPSETCVNSDRHPPKTLGVFAQRSFSFSKRIAVNHAQMTEWPVHIRPDEYNWIPLASVSIIFGIVAMPFTYNPILRAATNQELTGKHFNTVFDTVIGPSVSIPDYGRRPGRYSAHIIINSGQS